MLRGSAQPKCQKLTSPRPFAFAIMTIDQAEEVAMGNVNLETIVHVVTIVGGVIALVLAGLQVAETWIEIGEKMRKRKREQRR